MFNKKSKYSGIKCADTRDPILGLGTYRVRVVAAVEGMNPGTRRESYKVSLRVESGEGETPVGSTATAIFFMTAPGLAELKRLAMAAVGCAPKMGEASDRNDRVKREEEYDAWEETLGGEGTVLEVSAGAAHPKNPTMVGRLVDVVVSKGKDIVNPQTGVPVGDYYRNFTWYAVEQ